MCAPGLAKTPQNIYGYSDTAQEGSAQVIGYTPVAGSFHKAGDSLLTIQRSDGSVGTQSFNETVAAQNESLRANGPKGVAKSDSYLNAIQGKHIKDLSYVAPTETASDAPADSGGSATPPSNGGGGGGAPPSLVSPGGGGSSTTTTTIVKAEPKAKLQVFDGQDDGRRRKKRTRKQAAATTQTLVSGGEGLTGGTNTSSKTLFGE